jgi:hypothetical protein
MPFYEIFSSANVGLVGWKNISYGRKTECTHAGCFAFFQTIPKVKTTWMMLSWQFVFCITRMAIYCSFFSVFRVMSIDL